jgi:signal transduction histidine kinase
MLFVSILADTMGLTITSENVATAARLTFLNVILITFLFKFADYIRRKIMVERPTKTITEATEKIMQGDFSVRIPPMQSSGMDGFNQIAMSINHMAEELSGVETLRTDFISNVSHEMKTPLAIMQNYGTLLSSPDLSEEKRLEYAKGITDSSKRMADMITNILKLNRLENQKIYPKVSDFNLSEQLCECLLQFENIWESSEIELETNIADDINIKADAELLSHVWNNLFSNAFKFTPKGCMVSVSLTATNEFAIIQVSDT